MLSGQKGIAARRAYYLILSRSIWGPARQPAPIWLADAGFFHARHSGQSDQHRLPVNWRALLAALLSVPVHNREKQKRFRLRQLAHHIRYHDPALWLHRMR